MTALLESPTWISLALMINSVFPMFGLVLLELRFTNWINIIR